MVILVIYIDIWERVKMVKVQVGILLNLHINLISIEIKIPKFYLRFRKDYKKIHWSWISGSKAQKHHGTDLQFWFNKNKKIKTVSTWKWSYLMSHNTSLPFQQIWLDWLDLGHSDQNVLHLVSSIVHLQ